MTTRSRAGACAFGASAFLITMLAVGLVAVLAADATVERTPTVRARALQSPPPGYRQLAIPSRLARPLTARSRTAEFKVTHGGRPGTLAVTLTENGDLVNAFASGSLSVDAFRQPRAGQPQVRPRASRRISTWDDFWDVLGERIRKCKEKYPVGAERNKCIDDAIIETIGEAIGG